MFIESSQWVFRPVSVFGLGSAMMALAEQVQRRSAREFLDESRRGSFYETIGAAIGVAQ
jgi:hypothetical protein